MPQERNLEPIPIILEKGSNLWRGVLIDSECLVLQEEHELYIVGFDDYNLCLILEIDFFGKGQVDRFYLPRPANQDSTE